MGMMFEVIMNSFLMFFLTCAVRPSIADKVYLFELIIYTIRD